MVSLALAALVAGCGRKSPTQPGPSGQVNFRGHASVDGAAEDTLTLPFGAGATLKFRVSTPTNPDTTSTCWFYQWTVPDGSADVLELGAGQTRTGTNSFVVLGGQSASILQGKIYTRVLDSVRSTKLDTLSNGEVIATVTCENVPDTSKVIALDSLIINYKRIVARDVDASIDIYHLTNSSGGVITAEHDTILAEFRNNDQEHTLLRAGPLNIGGNPTIERHRLDGQDYTGEFLFKIPFQFDVLNRLDVKSQVPLFSVSMPGPRTELALVAPNGRQAVLRTEPLVLQWTGGNDTAQVELVLTDSQGHATSITALDNGRYDLTSDQLAALTPGLIRVTTRRTKTQTFLKVAGPPQVNVTMKIHEESKATFYLQ